MLVLTRHLDEKIVIGGYIFLSPIRIRDEEVFFELWWKPDHYGLFRICNDNYNDAYAIPVKTRDSIQFVEVRVSGIDYGNVRIGFRSHASIQIDRFEVFQSKQFGCNIPRGPRVTKGFCDDSRQ